jgi:hypothetical protein
MVCRGFGSYYMYIWVNTLVDSSRLAAAGDADFRRSRVGRCVGCYISMHLCMTLLAHGLLPCSPVVRASVAGYEIMSMFSFVGGQLFADLTLQSYNENCSIHTQKSNPLLFNLS